MPTVLVTGASRGLGLEFTRQYAVEGWNVVACARDPDAAADLRKLAQDSAGHIDVRTLDVTDHAGVERLAAALQGRAIDVLLNCAGTMGSRRFATEGLAADRFGEVDYAAWEHVLRVNVMGPMKMCESFITHVAGSGEKKIVNVTSVIGSIASNRVGGLYAYRASKAALNAITRSLSIDLARLHGVIVTPLHPGWARTEMGGPRADIDASESVSGMRRVIAALDSASSGKFFMYDGSELPW